MWLTYNYRLGKFVVPFTVWLQLMSIRFCLYFRRCCRFSKRVFIYIRPLFLIILLAALFAGLSGVLGVTLGEYDVWHEAFWDLRMFLFTSVFLTAISLVANGERSHRKKLIEQENEYFDFLYHAEQFFQNMLDFYGINIEFDLFQTDSSAHRFYNVIDCVISAGVPQESFLLRQTPAQFSQYANSIDCLKFFLGEFITPLSSAKDFSNMLVNNSESTELVGLCNRACKSIREELFIIQTSIQHDSSLLSTDVLQFIKEFHGDIYLIIACLRRPWRYEPDFSLDIKVRNILATYGHVAGETYNPLIHWE